MHRTLAAVLACLLLLSGPLSGAARAEARLETCRNTVLRIGSWDDCVTVLQVELANRGWATNRQGNDIHVDGYFGPETQELVLALQRSSGLTADGVVGSATWKLFDRSYRNHPWITGVPPAGFDCLATLRRGSSGPCVAIMQAQMGLFVDGAYGPETEQKVAAWQRSRGLQADGVFGPASRRALMGSKLECYQSVVRRGDKGYCVRLVQQRFADMWYGVRVDGDFGPGTEALVRGFQQRHRLPVDGRVGPDTWAMLMSASF